MNREILFKGKRKDNGEWVYGNFIYGHGFGNPIYKISVYTTMGALTGFEEYDIIPETLCQYTGFKDKNGTKIFEGDKIRINGVEKIEYGGFEIEWKDNFILKKWLEDEWAIEFEVIGNVHEEAQDV